MVLFVRNRQGPAATETIHAFRIRPLLRRRPFRRLCVVAALLGLVTVGDGFVYLVLADRDDLPVAAFPLLAVGTSLTFVLLAIPRGPAGRSGRPVADRRGRLLLPARGLSDPERRPRSRRAGRACSTGPSMPRPTESSRRWPHRSSPDELKTTGLALLQTGQALAYFASSVIFGVLWQYVGVNARLSRGGDRGRTDAAGGRAAAAAGRGPSAPA